VLIRAYGYALEMSPWEGRLYLPHLQASGVTRRPVELRFVPYHQWGNRGAGQMRVWVPAG